MTMTLSQTWRVYLLVLFSGLFVLLPQYALSASCDTARSFVRSYYDDLERNDVGAARAKWIKPPKNFARSVRNFSWTTVHSTSLNSCSGRKASVYIDVTVKAYGERAENWEGSIYLKSIRGSWKISSMRLHEN
ncbi:MAG: hypothetical protein DRQ41_09940 [Gammaproteobacteria bacterium]|nr:MAG: hypothetical protein DRQ41_09940 [Gammaproteobacteria bacterium]